MSDKWLDARNAVGAVFISQEISSPPTEAEFDALNIPGYDSTTVKALFGKWKRAMRIFMAWARYVLNTPPTVANALVDQNVAVDGALSYQFASNSFASSSTINYVIVDMPSWISFNAGTRTFTGTAPSQAGVFTVTVRAVDPQKGYVDDSFTVTVS